MNKRDRLDKTDLRILKTLQRDARITNQSLAEEVSLSPSSCLQRVRRLEKDGFLQGYNARLNLDKISRHVMCIASVTLKNHTQDQFKAFEKLVNQIPEVVECYTVSGECDCFIRVIAPDMGRYLEINDRLCSTGEYEVSI